MIPAAPKEGDLRRVFVPSAGTYLVRALAEGRLAAMQEVAVHDGAPRRRVELRCEKATAVEGTVLGSERQRLGGAVVMLQESQQAEGPLGFGLYGPSQAVTADERGRFAFKRFDPRAKYVVTVRHDGQRWAKRCPTAQELRALMVPTNQLGPWKVECRVIDGKGAVALLVEHDLVIGMPVHRMQKKLGNDGLAEFPAVVGGREYEVWVESRDSRKWRVEKFLLEGDRKVTVSRAK